MEITTANNNPPAVKRNFSWSERTEVKLVQLTLRNEAHKRTKGKTKEQKWEYIRLEVLRDRDFQGIDFKPRALEQKYLWMEKDVCRRYALEAEGANLSGLPDPSMMPELDSLLYAMIEDKLKTQVEKDLSTERDRKRDRALLTNDGTEIAKQVPRRQPTLRLDLTGDNGGDEASTALTPYVQPGASK